MHHYASMRALVASALLFGTATAVLRDRSQASESSAIRFPQWYRDNNNLALGLCKYSVESPNVAGKPMCLSFGGNDPAGAIQPNLGGELFYNTVSALMDRSCNR